MKSFLQTTPRRRAVTLTELLVVLAIISLLATLAVPVYVNKTEQARRATARAEVRAIANAQEIVAATHQLYVPMHLLDNLANDSGGGGSIDDFDNDTNPGNKFFIDPFTSLAAQISSQNSLSDALNNTATNQKPGNLVNYWTGPFLNPSRVAIDPTVAVTSAQYDNELSSDIILDPWGNPYLFYSPIGVLADNVTIDNFSGFDATNASTRYQFDNGQVQNGSGDNDPFDRYAIISYGPDGTLDTTLTAGTFVNDVYYQFGFIPNESAFNIF